jgi:trans-aconitate methyltransferase
MNETAAHWDKAYTVKAEDQVSWFQPLPQRSLEMINKSSPDGLASVIDVGGGASRLVDALLAGGFADLTVLDVSAAALERSRVRLGAVAGKVAWIVADMTSWQPQRRWGIWHDRAVFHFLTEAAQQAAYVKALAQATDPGATIVMSTFAPDGPERCSGLPVQRYSAASLAERLGEKFLLLEEARETHHTPFGTTQQFSYAVFRRLP